MISLGFLLLLTLCLLPGTAFAQVTAESNAVAIDTLWTLLAAFLVFFMQAGFALVESGFTRMKSTINIMMKNLMDFSLGSLSYAMVGFGLMFGATQAGLFGTDGFFMSTLDPSTGDGLWQFAFWMFQAVFAATAATIVSGAMAERTKFSGYLVYSIFITALIYPVVGHWIWGGGWLAEKGLVDFAGSTVVHSVGGWAALAGALTVGARIGKFGKNGQVNAIHGHNIPLAALGVFILWLGWFGFNAGSTTSATNLSISVIVVVTNLAAASGALGAMVSTWIRHGKPDLAFSLNGALAGLVGITAGCATISPLGAVIIGLVAGVLVEIAVEFIERVLRVDDPVGAISVHGVCGAWGTIAVGLFASAPYGEASGSGPVNGLFYGGGADLLITQVIGVVAVFIWTFGSSIVLFNVVKQVVGLRVSRQDEILGVDLSEHGMEGYPGFERIASEYWFNKQI